MTKLKSQIESLLFIAAKPMSVLQFCELLKADKEEVKKAGDELVEEYRENKKGIQIIKNGSKYQMVSSPENAKVIQDFIMDETTGELSRPSLEALTIIAYRGPVSKIDLDRIRGVNCALIIRNLLIRGLVEAKFNKQKNETYYTVTLDFIRFLGINDVNELPDYERLAKDDAITRFLGGETSREEGAEAASEEDGINEVIDQIAEAVASGETGDAEEAADSDEQAVIIAISDSSEDHIDEASDDEEEDEFEDVEENDEEEAEFEDEEDDEDDDFGDEDSNEAVADEGEANEGLEKRG